MNQTNDISSLYQLANSELSDIEMNGTGLGKINKLKDQIPTNPHYHDGLVGKPNLENNTPINFIPIPDDLRELVLEKAKEYKKDTNKENIEKKAPESPEKETTIEPQNGNIDLFQFTILKNLTKHIDILLDELHDCEKKIGEIKNKIMNIL